MRRHTLIDIFFTFFWLYFRRSRVADVNNRTVLHSKANAAFEKHAASFPDILN
ncbi:MAG: hypothetical protein V2A54_14800 [Bacteroidota bacterium]